MESRPPDRPGDPPARRGEPGGDGGWRRILTGGSARSILASVVEGDPLGIRERCWQRILDEALFLDPNRLLVKACARIAYRAAHGSYDGVPPLAAWLAGRIDEAVADLRVDDLESERHGMPVSGHDAPFFGHVAEVAEIELDLARRVCLVLNQLPLAQRLPFFRLVVQGAGPEEVAAELDVRPEDLLETLERTFEHVLLRARRMDGDLDGDPR